MAQRKVIWTQTADRQFLSILEFWVENNQSNKYSKELIKVVSERAEQIAKNPLMFKKTDYGEHRVASLGNFSIFYLVENTRIIISAFWDNRQDPDRLMKLLK